MAATGTAAADATGSHERAGDRARTLAYQPALDGVRALAVLAVLLFHAGVPHVTGGYLGVSVFFTLSGFLITTLLIREHGATNRVAAAAFYGRRAKRLLPASVLCITVVAAFAVAGAFDQVAHLRRDVAGAALEVYNWVALGSGGSYADLFSQTGGQASPLAHYWSLAIEEQFYWLWPVSFVLLARAARRLRWSLVVAIGIPAAAFVALAPVIARVWGPDAAYWATPARIGEILTGALAAAIVAERGAPGWTRRAAPWCLVLIGVGCVTFPASGGPAYAGWLPLLSVITATALVGLQHPGGAREALAWRPLVAIGTISYGVYLYHWPIFVLLDQGRVGHGGVVLLVVRFAVTFAAAIASYRVLEGPIRRRSMPPRTALAGGLALTVFALALVLVVPDTGPSFDTAGDAAEAAAIDPAGPTGPLSGSADADSPDPVPVGDAAALEESWRTLAIDVPAVSRPVRILVLGDSTAEATGGGLARWAAANPEVAQVSLEAAAGCGFVQGGVRVFPEGDEEIAPACADYVEEVIADRVARLQPDVVVLQTTAWDVINQRFDGGDAEAPTDPEYRRRIERDLTRVTDTVLAAGAPAVVWIAEPTVNPIWNPVHSPQEEPERHEVLHRTMRSLAAAQPERVAVADLAWWMTAAGLDEDREARPDGVHLSAPAAERVATDWLGPLLVTAALRAG